MLNVRKVVADVRFAVWYNAMRSRKQAQLNIRLNQIKMNIFIFLIVLDLRSKHEADSLWTNTQSLFITPSSAQLCVEATLVHIHWYGISLS